MSTVVYCVVTAIVTAYIVLAVALYRREQRRPLERDRIVAAAHARATAAHEIDDLELAWSLPALDPAWDAGRERLWDAVRDNQNQTKGD